MRRLAVFLCLAMSAAAQERKREAKADTMTGCLDQRDGDYILAEEKTLRKLASLEPQGFDRESFAKYVGHKVALTGRRSGEGERVVMKVRTVKTLSEVCR